MIEIGDLQQFGFRIGRVTSRVEVREVSILFMGGDLTYRDNSAYLPSFIGQLAATSRWLKRKIDYLKNDRWFRELNVTEIHNLLLHENLDLFSNELEWEAVRRSHQFSDWGETTDGFVTFLIPYCDRLFLTCQSVEKETLKFSMQPVVDAIETTPFYLIKTLDDAISILEAGMS